MGLMVPAAVATRASGGGTTGTSSVGVSLSTGASIARWNLLTLRMALDNALGPDGDAPFISIEDPRGNVWKTYTVANISAGTNQGTTVMSANVRVEHTYEDGDLLIVRFWTTQSQVTPLSVPVRQWAATEWSGVSRTQSIVLEQGVILLASGTNPSAPASTSSQVGDLLLADMAVEGPVEDSIEYDTADGWTGLTRRGSSLATAASNQTINGAWKVAAVGGGGEVWNPTLGVARDYAIRVRVFRAATTTEGTAAVTLPGFTAGGTAAAKVEGSAAATLPAFEAGGEAQFVDLRGDLAVTLPAFEASIQAQSPGLVQARLEVALPAFVAGVEGNSNAARRWRFFPPTVVRPPMAMEPPILRRFTWEHGVSVVRTDAGFANLLGDLVYPEPGWIEGVDYFVGGFHYRVPEYVALQLVAAGYTPNLEEES